MSQNHNQSIFNANNINVFNNEMDNVLYEGKVHFYNAKTLEDKYQIVHQLHLLLVKEFSYDRDKINVENFKNLIQELCKYLSDNERAYLDISGYKTATAYFMWVFSFWNGIATWLQSKNNRDEDNKLPMEYPFFNGNMDLIVYYSQKILVWEHKQMPYIQFVEHAIRRDETVRMSIKDNPINDAWRKTI